MPGGIASSVACGWRSLILRHQNVRTCGSLITRSRETKKNEGRPARQDTEDIPEGPLLTDQLFPECFNSCGDKHFVPTMDRFLLISLSVNAILVTACHAFLLPMEQRRQQQRCWRRIVTPASHRTDVLLATAAENDDDGNDGVYVMVNGMPGPMATAAAEACLRKGLALSPFAVTGPDIEPATVRVADAATDRSASVRLIPSTDAAEIGAALAGLRRAAGGNDNLQVVAIDYTHPSAVNSNAEFYVENDIPFVMGTTGGDRDALMKTVENHSCVIAPNMGKQIVAMQAALERLANDFPGAFAGYRLTVVESHQKTKADTSGTAKAVVDSIKVLCNDDGFTYDNIEMIRNDEDAVAFGVPEDALKGHAFHTYTLTSPDGSVEFQLKHNVAGRTIYAEGTADAVKFLVKKLKTGGGGKVYNMIDVLQEGALE
jgi:4-hydroxy-tetrahydrodipicolinate reductase